jgi:hypothetical protein
MINYVFVVADYKDLPPHCIVENEFWIQMMVVWGEPKNCQKAYFGLN